MSVFDYMHYKSDKLDGGAGIVIGGEFGTPEVNELINKTVIWEPMPGVVAKFPLILSDPPYGNIVKDKWDVESYIKQIPWMESRLTEGGSLYLWGGIGKSKDRPFLHFLSCVESLSRLTIQNVITWSKKRAYGKKDDYLFTREECAWLTLGPEPNKFNIPLLDVKRGYAGFNSEYPAKSEFLRRTNVWTDINELFTGKFHPCQKPEKLYTIPILAHTDEGDWVMDPYAGSGVTARACMMTNRRFVIVEKDKGYYANIIENLAQFDPKKV